MKRTSSLTVIGWIGLAVLAVLPAVLTAQQTPRQLFERARISEESGKLPEAIKLYEQVAAQSNGDRELAARAQFQIGLAYEKLDSPEARKAYEQVLARYAKEPVAESAKQRLAALSRSVELVERRICSDCGGALPPFAGSFSADGRLLALPWGSADGALGLVVRDIASGKETQITDDWPGYSVFSPDLKQIVYSCCPFNGEGRLGLKIVANRPGAKPKVLNSNPEYSDFIPSAWRPDSNSILVAAERAVDRTWMLAWASASDGSVTPLKSLGWRFSDPFDPQFSLPALSPDGRYIAYAARVNDLPPTARPRVFSSTDSQNTNEVHIHVLAADGSSDIELVKGASINQSPVWMPDGKSLLFVSNRGGSFGLWSVSLKDGSLKQVKADFRDNAKSVVSPSGDYLYLRSFDGRGQLVVSKRGTNASEEILSGTAPAWSPDGKSIAFIRTKDNTPIGQAARAVPMAALLVYSLDTRDEKRYVPNTELGAVFGSPVWSHDGKFLLQVIQDSKGIRSLYRVDLKTGEFKQIAGNVGDEVVALSSYDETIYMTHPPERGTCPSQSITAIDLSSGRQREIVSLPMRRARFSDGRAPVILSFDEKTLYAGVCGEGIVSVDLATGVQKQILSSQDAVRERGIDLSLSPDERTLAFIVWNADGSRLYRIGVAGTGYRKLADMNSNARMSWSGDGTILLLEQEKPEPINIPRNGNDPEVRSVQGCVNGCSPDGLRVVKRRDPYLELWALDNEWRASCRT